jgi:hypothetical protein
MDSKFLAAGPPDIDKFRIHTSCFKVSDRKKHIQHTHIGARTLCPRPTMRPQTPRSSRAESSRENVTKNALTSFGENPKSAIVKRLGLHLGVVKSTDLDSIVLQLNANQVATWNYLVVFWQFL